MEERKNILKEIKKREKEIKKYNELFFGFPCNACFNYKKLFGFMNYPINNAGDPFVPSSYKLSTKDFEQKVLKFFAKLYKIKEDVFWGYVTSGGTEGNMYGLFLARELYPNGRLYFSEDSHYSILKIARILKLKYSIVKSLNSKTEWGEIDVKHLEKLLIKYKKSPPILNLNIGTTIKGGIDNLNEICAIFKRHNIKEHYIHCDAALFGMIIPFLKKTPIIDFTQPIKSIAISGHKFIGSPIPCGIVLTKKEFVKRIETKISYIDILDTTLSGSRNGITPLILWYAIKTRKLTGFRKEVNACIRNSKYLYASLRKIKYPARLNEFSNIVVIKKPVNERFVKRWQLVIQGDYAHIVVMQHITKQKIDRFISELKKTL